MLACLLYSGLPLFGQPVPAEEAKVPSVLEYFIAQSGEVLEMKLVTDLKRLDKERAEEPYLPALLSVHLNDLGVVKMEVKIKARGKTRKELCDLPPVKLNFPKDMINLMGMDMRYDKVKVVLTCRSRKNYPAYLFREHLAYLIYNHIAPERSLRVQLVRFQLVDLDHPRQSETLYGFLVEDEDEMADRLDASITNSIPRTPNPVDPRHYFRFALFQYMIGNTDWSLSNSHNVQILQPKGEEQIVLVPYDFDYSGIVNADYAVPHRSIPIEAVTERYYKGNVVSKDILQEELHYFALMEPTIRQLVEQYPYLEPEDRSAMWGFLSGFFELLKNEEAMRKSLRY